MAAHPTRSVRLAEVRDAVPFADGALVRLDGDARRLLIDLGVEAEAFGRLLTRVLDAAPDRPKPSRSASARWREVEKGGFPAAASAAQRFCERAAADPFGWEIPGTVALTGADVVLENVVGVHTIPTSSVTSVSLSGHAVGIRQASGTGWVAVFDRREHAQDVCAWISDRLMP